MDISVLLALVPAKYAVYVAAVLGVCAVITANVPPPANPKLSAIWRVLNLLGQNYKHAANGA